MKISVALAYYNGGEYIQEQLDSILKQLKKEDEVILSIDRADDGSRELLEKKTAEDGRIHLLEGPGKGVVQNFAHAITHCHGDIIFLSDQDDIWREDKVKKVMDAFEKSGMPVILHDAQIVDKDGRETGEGTLFALRGSRSGIIKNLWKNSYVGCCMAFQKEILPVILPIPEEMYMHDYWIGTAGECLGGTAFLAETLIGYRRHGDNVTDLHHGSLLFMIRKRFGMIKCLGLLKKRIRGRKRQGELYAKTR